MSKGLLVDFGGVLTTSVLEAFAAFAHGEGLDPAELASLMRDTMAEPENFFVRVELGQIDTADFEIAFAETVQRRLGVPVTSSGLKARLFARSKPCEEMLDALRAARRAGIRTALLSNSWGVTEGGYPVHQFDELFDATIISGEVGLRKPHPEIYLLAAERTGCEPKDCVFVDDLSVNVDGAVAVGMTGIHHRDHATTIPELERIFGVPLR